LLVEHPLKNYYEDEIYLNHLMIKEGMVCERKVIMKKMLLTIGDCLLLVVALVIIRTLIIYFFPNFESSKALSYVLYFIFVVGCILIIRHIVKR
jgi:hypothetical protein